MIYVSVQPDNPYFYWQIKVMATNLINWGVKPENIHNVWMVNNGPSKSLLEHNLPGTNFYYQLEDVKGYLPALKPQGMKKHCDKLGSAKFCMQDSDVIWLRKPMLDNLCGCYWHTSDCRSYLNTRYIKSKGEDIFQNMASIVGVNPKFIEAMDHCAGGAQWVMNNTTFEYWDKVERDSVNLYHYLRTTGKGQKYPIQAWTAEMWATLWNALMFGKDVTISNSLSFTFATSRYEDLKDYRILHLAGVMDNQRDKLFFKGDYTSKSPIGLDFSHLSKEYAAYRYVEELSKLA